MKNHALTLLFCALFVLGALPAGAGIDPMDARGLSLDKVYDFHDLDSVSTFNGNLNVRIPIGQEYTVGDGLKYRIFLTYNSTIWDQEDITPIHLSVPNYVDPLQNVSPDDSRVESVPERWFNAGLGWHVTLGELRRGEARADKLRYSYVTPDGASHFFYDGLHGAEGSNSDPDVSYTRDGTYIRLRRVNAGNDRIVETGDGVKHYFKCTSDCAGGAPTFALQSMTDGRANAVYVCTTDTKWTIKEVTAAATLPVNPCDATVPVIRQHTVTFEASSLQVRSDARWNRWRIKSIELAAPHGQTALYSFDYQPGGKVLREPVQTIDWPGYDAGRSFIKWNNDYTINVDLLSKVTFPVETGLSWQFEYFGNLDSNRDQNGKLYQCSTDAAGNCSTAFIAEPPKHPWSEVAGRLKAVVLPTKGRIEYNYERWGYPRRSCNAEGPVPGPGPKMKARGPHAYNMGVTRRKASGGTTFYAGYARDPFASPDPCEGAKDFVGTTIDPLGNANLTYYSIALNDDVDPNGWRQDEYGLPFTHNLPADITQLPAGTKENFFLSQETYQCGVNYMPADPKYNELKTAAKNILASAACGAPKRATWVRYEFSLPLLCSGDYSGPDCLQSNRRVKTERVVYNDDVDQSVAVYADTLRDDFDGHGNYRSTTLDDSFGEANLPQGASDTMTTYRNYNPGRSITSVITDDLWLLSRFDEERVTDAAGTLQSQALFQYAANGFLTGKRTLSKGNIGPTGRLSTTDVLLLQSRAVQSDGSILIGERYYGGDRGGVNDVNAFSATAGEQYRIDRTYRYGAEEKAIYIDGIGNDVLDLSRNTIDPSSGMVVETIESFDPNAAPPYEKGLVTSYTYDATGRLAQITPQAPQKQASVSYEYTSLTDGMRVDIKRPAKDGSLYWAALEIDAFGRKRSEERKMPDGSFNFRSTSYLANGWKSQESTIKKKNLDQTVSEDEKQYFTTYDAYDAFGRPGTIILPDGSKTVLTYAGARTTTRVEKVATTTTGMTDITTWEHRDRRGNLVKVAQSTADAAGDLVAKYVYDTANRLTTVTQGNQTRKFFYDKRGFLTSEVHPELLKDVKYDTYDARGHYGVRKYIGSAENELRYAYDRAERVLTISQPEGAKILKNYDYHADNQDACGNYGFMKGRLERATRHNWVQDPARTGSRINVNVGDYFSYDDDGLVRFKTTSADRAKSAGDPEDSTESFNLDFKATFGYDKLGIVNSIQYPGCTGCALLTAPPAQTAVYTITQGRPEKVSGFVTDIKYHPNGLMTKVTHQVPGGTAVSDIIGVKTNGMARPESMYTDGAHDENGLEADWNADAASRPLDYDGVGDIRQTGLDSYTYDGARRLSSACIGGRLQSYAYDEWGNLTKITTYSACAGGAKIAEQVNTVAGTTNRLADATYDDFGNVRTQGGDEYSWDAFNTMVWARTKIGPPVAKPRSPLGKVFLYDANDERVAVADYRIPPADGSAEGLWRTRWTWTLRDLDHRAIRQFEQVKEGAAPGTGPFQWTNDYVYVNGRLVATTTPSGVRHQHTDHLGTPRLVTDSTGLAVAAHKYYPFGEEMTFPDADPSRLRFTGHERDNNNLNANVQDGDLDYMHARYYMPVVGRFMTVDPGRDWHAERPQSWNLYTYVMNRPISDSDPDGRESAEEALRRQRRAIAATAQQNLDPDNPRRGVDAKAAAHALDVARKPMERIAVNADTLVPVAGPVEALIFVATPAFLRWGTAASTTAVESTAAATPKSPQVEGIHWRWDGKSGVSRWDPQVGHAGQLVERAAEGPVLFQPLTAWDARWLAEIGIKW